MSRALLISLAVISLAACGGREEDWQEPAPEPEVPVAPDCPAHAHAEADVCACDAGFHVEPAGMFGTMACVVNAPPAPPCQPSLLCYPVPDPPYQECRLVCR